MTFAWTTRAICLVMVSATGCSALPTPGEQIATAPAVATSATAVPVAKVEPTNPVCPELLKSRPGTPSPEKDVRLLYLSRHHPGGDTRTDLTVGYGKGHAVRLRRLPDANLTISIEKDGSKWLFDGLTGSVADLPESACLASAMRHPSRVLILKEGAMFRGVDGAPYRLALPRGLDWASANEATRNFPEDTLALRPCQPSEPPDEVGVYWLDDQERYSLKPSFDVHAAPVGPVVLHVEIPPGASKEASAVIVEGESMIKFAWPFRTVLVEGWIARDALDSFLYTAERGGAPTRQWAKAHGWRPTPRVIPEPPYANFSTWESRRIECRKPDADCIIDKASGFPVNKYPLVSPNRYPPGPGTSLNVLACIGAFPAVVDDGELYSFGATRDWSGPRFDYEVQAAKNNGLVPVRLADAGSSRPAPPDEPEDHSHPHEPVRPYADPGAELPAGVQHYLREVDLFRCRFYKRKDRFSRWVEQPALDDGTPVGAAAPVPVGCPDFYVPDIRSQWFVFPSGAVPRETTSEPHETAVE